MRQRAPFILGFQEEEEERTAVSASFAGCLVKGKLLTLSKMRESGRSGMRAPLELHRASTGSGLTRIGIDRFRFHLSHVVYLSQKNESKRRVAGGVKTCWVAVASRDMSPEIRPSARDPSSKSNLIMHRGLQSLLLANLRFFREILGSAEEQYSFSFLGYSSSL